MINNAKNRNVRTTPSTANSWAQFGPNSEPLAILHHRVFGATTHNLRGTMFRVTDLPIDRFLDTLGAAARSAQGNA